VSEFNHKQWIESIVNNENTLLYENSPAVVYNNTAWPELIKQITGPKGRTWRYHVVWCFTFGEAVMN